MLELQVKVGGGKLVLQGEIMMLIGVIKVPTAVVWSFHRGLNMLEPASPSGSFA